MATPRKTYVLKRGQYDQHGDVVSAGMPASLPAWLPALPNNRLGLAKWLVAPSHPLTARVAVNQWWQTLFGTGIDETVEDLGSQGAWPSSSAELLDWLACELKFAAIGMSKLMLKLDGNSISYLSSVFLHVTPELLEPRSEELDCWQEVRY